MVVPAGNNGPAGIEMSMKASTQSCTHEEAQEQEERFYLDKFLPVLQVKPDRIDRGPVVSGANRPDFILTIGTNIIGVEVTGFHSEAKGVHGQPRRAVEEQWRKLIEVFQSERKQYPQLDNINGMFFFRKLEVPPSRQHEQFITESLDFATENINVISVEGLDFCSFPPEFPLLNQYLEKLYLQKAGCYITWEWNHCCAAVGANESELKTCIFPKLKNPRPDKVTENWLLVISGHELSQAMGMRHVGLLGDCQDLNDALLKGPYDKVYIFQYLYDRILLWQRSGGWAEVRKARFPRPG